MGTAIESGVGLLNYGKQTAKGTPATAATTTVGYNRPKLFDGAAKAGTTLGSETYVDGNRFASPSSYVDTIGGDIGGFTIQAQPENATLYWAQFFGADTVTGSGDPYTHTTSSAATGSGAWGTWWQKVGVTVIVRQLFSDCRIAKIVQMSGDKQKPMHQTLSLMSLNPAETYETDAAKTEDATDPFYFPETTGALEMDGSPIGDIDEEVIEADAATKPFFGNSTTAQQLIDGKGAIVSTIKGIVTSATLPFFNKAIYGEAAPATGTKPAKTVYYLKAKTVYKKSATRTLTFERPKVEVKPDEMVIAPQREGGEVPISFGGQCHKEGGTAALTVVGLTADATAY